jgi:hypothetical protein
MILRICLVLAMQVCTETQKRASKYERLQVGQSEHNVEKAFPWGALNILDMAREYSKLDRDEGKSKKWRKIIFKTILKIMRFWFYYKLERPELEDTEIFSPS